MISLKVRRSCNTLAFRRQGKPTMKSLLVVLAALLSLGFSSAEGDDVVILTGATFEHDTQATTGATTGDWFVKFYAPWCGHCKKLTPIWDQLATELKGQVNVAKVDLTEGQSKSLSRRFDIKGYPTLIYFSHGKMYRYKGPRTQSELKAFAEGGFKEAEAEIIPKPTTLMSQVQEEVSTFIQVMQQYAYNPDQISKENLYFLSFGAITGAVLGLLIRALRPSPAKHSHTD